MGAIMGQFCAGLTAHGLAQAGVQVRRGGTAHRVGGRGEDAFLILRGHDGGVVGLAADFVLSVGRVGVAGGCGADWVGFQVEFTALVSLIDLATGLVLNETNRIQSQ